MPTTISNPWGSGRALYVRLTSRPIVEQDLSLLVRDPTANLDYASIVEDLLGRRTRRASTLWRDVACIPPGCSLVIPDSADAFANSREDVIEPAMPAFAKNIDVMLALESAMAAALKDDHRAPYIALSGGRDSTALAHILSRLKAGGGAVTWAYPRGGSHDDVTSAAQLVRALGLKHVVQEVDPKQIFSVPIGNALRPRISTSTAFFEVIRNLIVRCQEDAGRAVTVFNGHGGDHLFLDPPPLEVILDSLRECRPLQAWARLRTLRAAYGCSMTQLLWRLRATKAYEGELAARVMGANSLTLLARPTSFHIHTSKQLHRDRIKQAIFDNSTSEQELAENTCYPFTSRGVVDCVWDTPCESFFDHCQRRIPFVQSFARYVGSDSLLRSEKGDVTGAFQRALTLKFDWLKKLVSEGVLANKKLIDTNGVLRLMDSSSRGYGGIEPILTKIISFELMMIK